MITRPQTPPPPLTHSRRKRSIRIRVRISRGQRDLRYRTPVPVLLPLRTRTVLEQIRIPRRRRRPRKMNHGRQRRARRVRVLLRGYTCGCGTVTVGRRCSSARAGPAWGYAWDETALPTAGVTISNAGSSGSLPPLPSASAFALPGAEARYADPRRDAYGVAWVWSGAAEYGPCCAKKWYCGSCTTRWTLCSARGTARRPRRTRFRHRRLFPSRVSPGRPRPSLRRACARGRGRGSGGGGNAGRGRGRGA
ncbi:hypothetical protein K438DRAFT_1811798 [Mycena galopus ATCC 62051]|nr:hypothetical protein K438DRAFT_1811798 [Mycena galopus ATCC 62051]